MRIYLVLAFIALPAAATAAPSLQCSYEGNTTKVVIVNSNDKSRRCKYACDYTIKNGSLKLSGERHPLKPGETYTREDTNRDKIEGVSATSLRCE